MNKRFFYSVGMILMSLFIIKSCSRSHEDEKIELDNKINKEVNLLGYKISEFSNKDKIVELKKTITNKLQHKNIREFSNTTSNIHIDNYDFEKVRKIEDSIGNVYYSIPKIDNPNEVIGLIPNNNEFQFISVKVDDSNERNIKTIEIRNINNTFFVKFGYNKTTGNSINFNENKSISKLHISEEDTKIMGRGCGQGVVNCMANIYGGLGWTSVAATLITAYQPEVAVAIAAGCAASRCL